MDFIYWLRRKRKSPQKTITARITIHSERKDFSTGIDIDPEDWLGKDFLIKNNCQLNVNYNETLALIKLEVLHSYNSLLRNKEPISAERVYKKYLSSQEELLSSSQVRKKIPSLMDILNLGMKRKYEQIGVKIKKSSYERYEDYQQNFITFLKREKINPSKMPITDLSLDLCNLFIKSLVSIEGKAPTTANKHTEILRIIVNTANYEADGWTLKLRTKDLNKHREPSPDKTHLNLEEIKTIENYAFTGRLDKVRDMLLMLCEIGQHIGDYASIVREGRLVEDGEGDHWIVKKRAKTNVEFQIHLSPRALRIINKYGSLSQLPIISDQKANDYLKLIAHYTGIDKNLTTKIGRKTFCNYYLNIKRVERKIVAKMMGLKSDKHLEHYAEENLETMKFYWKKAG